MTLSTKMSQINFNSNIILHKIEQYKDLWKNNTPLFVLDKSLIVKNINKFSNLFDGEIAYSLKTNSEKEVIKTIHLQESNFSVCSIEELEILKKIIKDVSKIIYYSPALDEKEMEKIISLGVRRICLDSENQIDLAIKNKDELMEVFLRVSTESRVNNEVFVYGKNSFLGVSVKPFIEHLKNLTSRGFKVGIHNHLTSQNNNLENWKQNLEILFNLVTLAKSNKIKLDSINLGGGFPVKYTNSALPLEEIANEINKFKKKVRKLYSEVSFIFEPGRGIVGDAAILITSIKQKKIFDKIDILVIDASLYNSSMDTLIVGLNLPVKVLKKYKKPFKKYIIRGKSPDSLDIFCKNAFLPELEIGEQIIFLNVGAYNFSSDFLHFKKPNVMVIN